MSDYGNLGNTRSAPNNILRSNLQPLVDTRGVRMYVQPLQDATMYGLGAVAQGSGSCAYGARASALQDGTVAIGTYASAKLQDSIAVGAETQASAYRAIAIGRTARATGANSIAFGTATNVTGANGISIGNTAVTGSNSIAIGKGANASISAIAIGTSATAASSSLAIGNSATTSGGSSIGIGNSVVNAFAGSIAIGIGATTTAVGQFVSGSTTIGISDIYFGIGPSSGVSSTATGYSIRGDEPAGSNQAGGRLRLAGGRSTGNGLGGDVVLATAAAGSSGSSINATTDRVYVKSTGQVLMGTSTPSVDLPHILEVQSTAVGRLNLSSSRTATSGVNISEIIFTSTQNSTSPVIGAIVANLSGSTAGDRGGEIVFYTHADNSGASANAVAIITQDGKVGIGTTSPQQLLDVHSASSQGIAALSTNRSISDGTNVSQLVFRAEQNTSDPVLATILCIASGSTSNDRGGELRLFVKGDGGGGHVVNMVKVHAQSADPPLTLNVNGTLYRMKVDESDLGSGSKKYLYLA